MAAEVLCAPRAEINPRHVGAQGGSAVRGPAGQESQERWGEGHATCLTCAQERPATRTARPAGGLGELVGRHLVQDPSDAAVALAPPASRAHSGRTQPVQRQGPVGNAAAVTCNPRTQEVVPQSKPRLRSGGDSALLWAQQPAKVSTAGKAPRPSPPDCPSTRQMPQDQQTRPPPPSPGREGTAPDSHQARGPGGALWSAG